MPHAVSMSAPTATVVRSRVSVSILQLVLLRMAQAAGAALLAKGRQAVDAIFLVQPVPGAHDVVVEQQHFGLAATQALVQQHQRVGAVGKPTCSRAVAGQLDQVGSGLGAPEATLDHGNGSIRFVPFGTTEFSTSRSTDAYHSNAGRGPPAKVLDGASQVGSGRG
jgi:hypothetical protein